MELEKEDMNIVLKKINNIKINFIWEDGLEHEIVLNNLILRNNGILNVIDNTDVVEGYMKDYNYKINLEIDCYGFTMNGEGKYD